MSVKQGLNRYPSGVNTHGFRSPVTLLFVLVDSWWGSKDHVCAPLRFNGQPYSRVAGESMVAYHSHPDSFHSGLTFGSAPPPRVHKYLVFYFGAKNNSPAANCNRMMMHLISVSYLTYCSTVSSINSHAVIKRLVAFAYWLDA